MVTHGDAMGYFDAAPYGAVGNVWVNVLMVCSGPWRGHTEKPIASLWDASIMNWRGDFNATFIIRGQCTFGVRRKI